MSNELTKKDDNLPISQADYEKLLEESRGEVTQAVDLRPPIISIAGSGANVFMKNDNAIGSKLKGVIIGQTRSNVFWVPDPARDANSKAAHEAFITLFDGINFEIPEPDTFPLCSSFDGIHGSHEAIESNRGLCFGNCNKCFLNQWESDLRGGKGKACKNQKRLLILIENSAIPNLLTLPPTSIRNFEDYCTALVEWGTTPLFVFTSIELEKKSTGAGINYSVAKFILGNKPDSVPKEMIPELIKLRSMFSGAMNIELSIDEVEPEIDESTTASPLDDSENDEESLPF